MKLHTRLIKLMTDETIDRDAILTTLEDTEEKQMETIQIVEDLVVLYEKKDDKRNVEWVIPEKIHTHPDGWGHLLTPPLTWIS